MLENRIQKDLINAMKTHDESAMLAIRGIKTAIQNEKTKGVFHELTDDEIVKIIQKLAKQHQESIDVYTEAGRQELADKESSELEIINKYLPKLMPEDVLIKEIESIISQTGASSMKDMGKVMKTLSTRFPNQYDGKVASTIIKEKLS